MKFFKKSVMFFLPAVLLLFAFGAGVPEKTTDWWPVLFKVKYGDWLTDFSPVFTPEIKKLDGKKIRIKGFLIPLEKKTKHTDFLLSAFPFDACFYCGKAGPETVLEVKCKPAAKYTEKPILLEGTLRLNANDPSRMFYVMDDAKVVKE